MTEYNHDLMMDIIEGLKADIRFNTFLIGVLVMMCLCLLFLWYRVKKEDKK